MRHAVVVLALALLMLATPAWAAERRVALVIANSAYQAVTPLANPVNDGKLVSAALEKAGFTVDLRDNLTLAEFLHALRDFRGQADGADIALIYYAGHGAQAEGQNYLVPTDAEMAAERDLDNEAVDLERLMTVLGGAKMRVAILDACRNNPFKSASSVAAVTNGLAQVDVDDVLVIFSAAPGKSAADGDGTNSPFARALAKRLPEPGLIIQRLGGVVRDDVIAATANAQRPFISASITGTPIYLVPGTAIASATGTRGITPSGALRSATAPPLAAPESAFAAADRWTASDPRLPLNTVMVERRRNGGFRVSGTYPMAKRDGSAAPVARIIKLVPYRIVAGRVARMPKAGRYRIGYWPPGAPFSITFPSDPAQTPMPDLQMRLCIGENDGPGADFCFYSPNLIKNGSQQLPGDLSGGGGAKRGIARRPRGG